MLSLQSISVNIGYNVGFGQVNQMKSLKIPTGKSKDRQNNDQDKKDKKTNNDLQNTSQKTKD